MAITVAMRTEITQLYVAMFGRAPDSEGLGFWVGLRNNGSSLIEIANTMYDTAPARVQYPLWMNNEEIVTSIYEKVLGRAADDEGLGFWTARLNSGVTVGDVVTEIIDAITNYTGTDPVVLASTALFNNKVTVAQYYGEHGGNIALSTAALAGITDLEGSVAAAIAAIDNGTIGGGSGGGGSVAQTLVLKVDADALTGGATNDTFVSNVVQNMLGAQVNTLGSGDMLNGGAGWDTLNAKVTAGAFINGNNNGTMPIQPDTSSIEVVKLEAVNSGIRSGDNTTVYINAKDMLDVNQIWSSRSDANLVIQNLTTKTSSGNAMSLSDMTVGMGYTGNDDSHWDESNYTVYFDQDYLTPVATRTNPAVDFLAMNEDNYDATDGAKPLDGVFFRELKFTLNGERFDLKPYLNEDPLGTGSEITTYEEFLVAVQEALVELKADNAGNAALQTVQAEFGGSFTTDANPETLELRVGTAIRLSVEGLTGGVANVLDVASTDLEVARAEGSLVPNNNRYELADPNPAEDGSVLSINVALEKVGLAGDGGELIIGSMNKTDDNDWDDVNTTTDTTSGIEQFDVTVYGANDKSSSLAGLHSTNNNLRVVNVVTDAALSGTSFADLTIGNSNTRGDQGAIPGLDNQYALKDVQTFDASGFKGDLTLFAALTDEVADKYLNLKDEAAADAADDNVAFEYTGGTGDDYFNVALDSANLAEAGTATREDFTLNIDGGAGNDVITLAIVDGDELDNGNLLGFESVVDNWYDNQKLLANVSIDGGDGNDTIWTPGSGDVIINAGAGNDTVYADNTGLKAVWAFNVATSPVELFHIERNQLDNLQSDVNNSYNLFETDVVVNFKGFEVKAAITTIKGKATDLAINQAIKKAINSDPVLSKLLVAKDGPANSLVVSSLIDGSMVDQDGPVGALTISLEGPTAADLSAGDVQQLRTWYGSSVSATDAATFASYFGTQIAAFNTKADYDENFALDGDLSDGYFGSDSEHVSDNTITGGTGDDVLVLGTGALSNDTIVYSGFGNGTDTIVNFVTSIDSTPIELMFGESEDTEETFTVTFPALTPTAAGTEITIAFDGDSVSLFNDGVDASVRPAADVAREFALSFVGTNWTAQWVPGTAQVEFTNVATGNFDDDIGTAGDQDVVAGDFVFGGTTGTPAVTISNYVDGTDAYDDADPATFTVDLNGSAAIADDTFVFSYDLDGAGAGTAKTVNVAYLAGDGPLALAAKFAAALNGSGDWVATTDNDGIVQVAAAVPGELDLNTYVYAGTTLAEIGDAELNGVEVVITASDDGEDQAGTAGTVYVLERAANDYIDFSAYDAAGVLVDGVLIAGAAATAGQKYVLMTESTTNDGSYTVGVYTEAGATDTLVGVVGVLDFGVEQDFVADNFIL